MSNTAGGKICVTVMLLCNHVIFFIYFKSIYFIVAIVFLHFVVYRSIV